LKSVRLAISRNGQEIGNSAIADKPHLCNVRWRRWRPKTRSSRMCHHVQFGRSRSQHAGITRRYPKNWGTWTPPLRDWEHASPLTNKLLSTNFLTFSVIATKNLMLFLTLIPRARMDEVSKVLEAGGTLESLGCGLGWLPGNMSLHHHVLSSRISPLQVKRYERNTEIRRKNLAPRVPPFKVTQGHRNRQGPIGYLWLPISTGVGSGGYAGDLTPQLFMWGILICISPLEKPNT